MVKLIYCLRRLPHLSREEFQHRWREHHGPLVRGTAEAANIHRYVQTHTIDSAVMEERRQRMGRPEPFDGVAELWYDSPEAFMPVNPSPEHREAIASQVADEQAFIDLAHSPLWLTEEHVFIDDIPEAPESGGQPGATIKLVYCLHRLSHLSRDAFQRYWRESHGPLVQKQQEALQIRRYVQSHTGFSERNEMLRSDHDRPEAFDGVATLWWDGIEEFAPANATPERQQSGRALFEDEQKFIDSSRSPNWLGREYILVGQ